MICSGWV